MPFSDYVPSYHLQIKIEVSLLTVAILVCASYYCGSYIVLEDTLRKTDTAACRKSGILRFLLNDSWASYVEFKHISLSNMPCMKECKAKTGTDY